MKPVSQGRCHQSFR